MSGDVEALLSAWEAAEPSAEVMRRAHAKVLDQAPPQKARSSWSQRLRRTPRRRTLAVALAVLAATGGAVAGVRATQDKSLEVPSANGPLGLPRVLAEDVDPATVRLAGEAYGYSFFTAAGRQAGYRCILFGPAGPRPDVVASSCGRPAEGQVHILLQGNRDGTQVGAIGLPAKATRVEVNGKTVRMLPGVAPFRLPDDQPVSVTVLLPSGKSLHSQLPASR